MPFSFDKNYKKNSTDLRNLLEFFHFNSNWLLFSTKAKSKLPISTKVEIWYKKHIKFSAHDAFLE